MNRLKEFLVCTKSPRHFLMPMLAVPCPIQRERDLRSACWRHVDVVVGQPGSRPCPHSTQLVPEEDCSTSVSREDQRVGASSYGRPVITMMWYGSVPNHSGTGVRQRRVLCEKSSRIARSTTYTRCATSSTLGVHAEGHRRWRSVAHHGGQGILAPTLILTTLRRRTTVISRRGSSALLRLCTANVRQDYDWGSWES
jgi:hypothetical protein